MKIKSLYFLIKSKKIKLHKKDINNYRSILSSFKNIDVVVHLAALSDIVPSISDPKNYLKTNMVESLMLTKKRLIKGDLIIVYGDIFFDKKIIDKINMKFDIIFFSAGFDAHKLDPLASINLENEDFAWVTKAILKKFAKDIPIISLLEGGYDMDGLYNGLDFHLKILDEYSNE